MFKELKFGVDAKQSIIEGVNITANAVKTTLGAKGNNVVIEMQGYLPHITKDGVTVANNINLEDKYQNIGCMLIKDCANRTASQSGDGTTTATILAQSLINNFFELSRIGISNLQIKKGLEVCISNTIEYIKTNKKDLTNNDEIRDIATISSNNDNHIGKIISDAYKSIGLNGILTTEVSNTGQTYLDFQKGYKFGNGYLTNKFINKFENNTCELLDCYVIVTNRKISLLREISSLIQKIASTNSPFLLVCEDIEDNVLRDIVINKEKGLFNCCVVKTPRFGMNRKLSTSDIALVTGAKLIDHELNMNFDSVELDELGLCKKVIVKRDSTILIDGECDQTKLDDTIKFIKSEVDSDGIGGEYRKYIEERLANLTGGMATIFIGGNSDVEITQSKDRIDDSIFATKSSIEEGIISGGGVALLRASKYIMENIESPTEDSKKIKETYCKSIEEPFKQLCSNCGINFEEAKEKILSNKDFNYGINMLNNEYQNLLDNGIIDPFKVTRTSLENSGSIAIMILTSECAIVNTPML